jgi:hypothetical protein
MRLKIRRTFGTEYFILFKPATVWLATFRCRFATSRRLWREQALALLQNEEYFRAGSRRLLQKLKRLAGIRLRQGYYGTSARPTRLRYASVFVLLRRDKMARQAEIEGRG